MFSRPGKRGNQRRSVDFGRWKFVEQLVHDAEIVAGKKENFGFGTTGGD